MASSALYDKDTCVQDNEEMVPTDLIDNSHKA